MVLPSTVNAQGLMDCGVQVTVVHTRHAMVKRLGGGSARVPQAECETTRDGVAPHVELPAKLLVALLLVVDHVEGGPLGLVGRRVLSLTGMPCSPKTRDC